MAGACAGSMLSWTYSVEALADTEITASVEERGNYQDIAEQSAIMSSIAVLNPLIACMYPLVVKQPR